MPSDMKLSKLNVQYLMDLANLSIRPKKDKKPKPDREIKPAKGPKDKPFYSTRSKSLPPPPPTRCPTCGHAAQAQHRASVDEHGVNAAKPPKPGGLFIRFENSPGIANQKLSSRRLIKLRAAIEQAVTNAGMLKPSSDETGSNPDSQSLDPSKPLRGSDMSKKALFKGTYGQVKQALKEAGLVATPCSENGFENATRLGALFVVNSHAMGRDGLDLTKLTLWG